MGYESKLYIVTKHTYAENDGMKYAAKIAEFDLCKMGDKFHDDIMKYPVTDSYFYADDGNTRVLEDAYGDKLIEIPVIDMIKILSDALYADPYYRRIRPALNLLLGFNLSEWVSDSYQLVVLHYGH